MIPAIYDASLADEQIEVGTEAAHAMVKKLAREEGLLVGVSGAAALVGSLKVVEGLKKQQPAMIVTILADSGNRYLSDRFWEEG
jgi:cysteine synthase B